MQTFLHHNKGYTKYSFTYIDWNTIENATKMRTLNRRIWLTKFFGGFSAIVSKIFARGTRFSPMCPICNYLKIQNTFSRIWILKFKKIPKSSSNFNQIP